MNDDNMTVESRDGLDLVEPDFYREGQRYVDGLVGVVQSARCQNFDLASEQYLAADCILAPLGEEGDSTRLRDFIAGTANAAEHYVRQLGVPIFAAVRGHQRLKTATRRVELLLGYSPALAGEEGRHEPGAGARLAVRVSHCGP